MFEPRQVELPPCNWEDDYGICMLDGCACDGECESYEPRPTEIFGKVGP